MNSDFVQAFSDAKVRVNKAEPKRGGYRIILRLVGWRLIPSTVWEMLTTFFVYLPAADYHRLICQSVNRNWEMLSQGEKQKVLAVLVRLDGHGEITAVLNGDALAIKS